MHSIEKGISVVVPVYNSEETLSPLTERVRAVLGSDLSSFELILVNDGSTDRSWEVVRELVEENDWIFGVNLMRNFGQHNALLCGVRLARFAIVVTIDDDLQHPPEEIPKLLKKLAEGYDVVYGAPCNLPHSLVRNLLSRATKRVLGAAMGIDRIVDINAFRAFRTNVRKAFDDFHSPNPMFDILLSWGASRFASVEVIQEPRRIGRSNYTLGKLFNQAMLLITGFTTAPLRIASFVGFSFTLVGIGIFFYVVVRYFVAGSLPGFPFLASIISIFSGAQLFALGIIGEYLARIFHRSMDKPVYVVESTLSVSHDVRWHNDRKIASTIDAV